MEQRDPSASEPSLHIAPKPLSEQNFSPWNANPQDSSPTLNPLLSGIGFNDLSVASSNPPGPTIGPAVLR